MSDGAGPIFIMGRQHSGNTMLARCLGRSPDVYSATGEGTFFEHQDRLARMSAPDRAAAILARTEGSGAEVPAGARTEAKRHMQGSHMQGNGTGEKKTAGQMYARCMDWVARQHGAKRWVQKATSYVFYVGDILEQFPGARLLFLARNPLDLAASMKRRGVWRAVARMTYGWNKGVRLALRASGEHPESVSVIRYEDFVRRPKQELKSICFFCDLAFKDDLLGIDHVNRSESPYNQSSEEKGINASRVGYYEKTLADIEVGAVRALTNDRLLKKVYPEMGGKASPSLSGVSYAVALATVAAGAVGGQHLKALLSNPHHALQRVKKRLLV